MIRNGEFTVGEVKRILRKYWWILPITAVGCTAIAIGVTYFLPKKYTSQTMVLVESPAVSSEIIKPVVTEAISQRMATIQQQILSRSALQPIIDKFGLYPDERGTAHIDDLVDRLESAISVTPLMPMQGS